jgi:FdhD protein
VPTAIAGEHPLTLYVDKREIVTLMTLGAAPEALTIGWLRNQRLVGSLDEIAAVQVDWEVDAVAVTTRARHAGSPSAALGSARSPPAAARARCSAT